MSILAVVLGLVMALRGHNIRMAQQQNMQRQPPNQWKISCSSRPRSRALAPRRNVNVKDVAIRSSSEMQAVLRGLSEQFWGNNCGEFFKFLMMCYCDVYNNTSKLNCDYFLMTFNLMSLFMNKGCCVVNGLGEIISCSIAVSWLNRNLFNFWGVLNVI